MIRFESIPQYNEFYRHPTRHPLVSLVELSRSGEQIRARMSFDFYLIAFKKLTDTASRLRYGTQYYDFQDGTLIFVAPGQFLQSEPLGERYQPSATVLAFHPDLIRGTALGKSISRYSFFSYQSNEALHLSQQEKDTILGVLANIGSELDRSIDKHSRRLVVSNIELLLNYCTRFYDRQFTTREMVNSGVVERFDELLSGYFSSQEPQLHGLPSVAYFADQLHLSPNYFGDLIKRETGKTPQEMIHLRIIDIARERALDPDRSIAGIATDLGFRYPQHFTRLFKQKTGLTPGAYRMQARGGQG